MQKYKGKKSKPVVATDELVDEQFSDDDDATMQDQMATSLRKLDENSLLLLDANAAPKTKREVGSCSTFGYCCALFSKTACRVAAGAAAGFGAGYAMGLRTPQELGTATFIGGLGGLIARGVDDCCDAARTVEAHQNSDISVARNVAEVFIPIPGPRRTFEV